MRIFWKYITDIGLKCRALVLLSSTLYALSIETKLQNKLEQSEDNSYNLSMGQSKFSYKLTLWFISIENRGKQM